MAVYAKLKSPCCWRNLSAIGQILNDDRGEHVARAPAPRQRLPSTHKPLTAGVLIMESVPPVIALFGRARVRAFAAIAMMLLHAVMIPAFCDVGVSFPMIMTTFWTVYLPPWFWDEGLPKARAFLAQKLPGAAEAVARGRAVFDRWLAKIPRRPRPEATQARWPRSPPSPAAAWPS